jgi:hypothetical protein
LELDTLLADDEFEETKGEADELADDAELADSELVPWLLNEDLMVPSPTKSANTSTATTKMETLETPLRAFEIGTLAINPWDISRTSARLG